MVPRTDGSRSNNSGSKKKWYATWNWKTYTLVGFSAVFVIVLSTFFFLLSSIWQRPQNPSVVASVYSSVPAQDLAVLKDRTNVLLIGVDERLDDAGRSDTIILVSIPSDESYITIVSIPRDTMVWLPETGRYDKINHLYNYQAPYGAEFLKSTVERLLDLEIKGYVVVNLDGFVDLVDELGGVTVDVGEERLYYSDPYQDLLIDLPPGEQHLNGKEAMGFVRYRDYANADIGRIGAQQVFIQAFVDEFMAKKYDVLRLPGLITKGLSMVRTDLGLPDIMALAGSTLKVAEKPIEKIQLIGDGVTYMDISYYMLRYEENLELIAEHFFSEDERERYVLEHLSEPWVRDYEYLRQRLYNEAVAQWERQYYGWGELEEAVTATVQIDTAEDPEGPLSTTASSTPAAGRLAYANAQSTSTDDRLAGGVDEKTKAETDGIDISQRLPVVSGLYSAVSTALNEGLDEIEDPEQLIGDTGSGEDRGGDENEDREGSIQTNTFSEDEDADKIDEETEEEIIAVEPDEPSTTTSSNSSIPANTTTPPRTP